MNGFRQADMAAAMMLAALGFFFRLALSLSHTLLFEARASPRRYRDELRLGGSSA
ncbi:hypothetical protein ACH196_02900 [Mesorhizobium sp. IMUNJ23232]